MRPTLLAIVLLPALTGCTGGPSLLHPDNQPVIDRKIIEYPANSELRRVVDGLTAPTAFTFDDEGNLVVAEGGVGGHDVRIFGFKPDGSQFDIYLRGTRLPIPNIPLPVSIPGTDKFTLYGPVGGVAFAHGKLYVSHRDESGKGVITAMGYDGSHKTIVADLPAQGDYGVTDLAFAPNGRLYFGVGAATNSGVVGMDNVSWLAEHREVCDKPAVDTYLLGRRFDTENPFSGIFGGADVVVTGPFQPFGRSIDTRIPKAPTGKPTAAIYSVDPAGGDMRVEAHGIRYPVGLGFSEQGLLYFTNQGMKLRGTRPVKDDPDAMLRLVVGQWYGWPDYATNLMPIRDPRFQPPVEMLVRTGYRDLASLVDHEASGLTPPNPNSSLLTVEFRPLAGASKFAFAPPSGPFSRLRQAGNVAIVALWGERAPFDTSGMKLTGPTGFKVVLVNIDDREVSEFIRNTEPGPGSLRGNSLELERPIDVKFGPDGALYILDFGRIKVEKGYVHLPGGTGKIFKLTAAPEK
ncbi:MAG: PQQ-dependent sugar dehydrogenase [Tepidisphaerales bacterium]